MRSHLGYLALATLSARSGLGFAALSAVFAAFGKGVQGVTASGAIAGAIVCFVLLVGAGFGGFAALLSVFLLTWACTRFGYARKQRLGIAEQKTGRDVQQVLANLGIAAGCALAFVATAAPRWLVAMAAALAEAAADTVSSEIGKAVGGRPRLITNWNRVAAGTNGAVTLLGTLAGAVGAVVVPMVCAVSGILAWRIVPICAATAMLGMIADSFLGATLERPGVLGNSGVNFASTIVSAVTALALTH